MAPAAATDPRPRVRVIHGPNLNLLGRREPEIYGGLSLDEIDRDLVALGNTLGLAVDCQHSNSEGTIVDLVQEAGQAHAALVLNPGGYSHTSVAIHDALRAIDIPAVEVHLSNIHAREPFRHTCLTGAACRGVVTGFGPASYRLALYYLRDVLVSSERV